MLTRDDQVFDEPAVASPTQFDEQQFKKQLKALKASKIQRFFARYTPCYTQPPIGQDGFSPPSVGFPTGLSTAGVLAGTLEGTLSLGLISLAIGLPAAVLTAIAVSFAIFELQDSNRDVKLANKEIKYLQDKKMEHSANLDNNFFQNTVKNYFLNERNLKRYSKKNILSLILKHEDKDTKIALLKACLGDPKLGKNQKNALAKRFWKQEGFFACNEDSGTLRDIKAHLSLLESQPQQPEKTINPGRYLNRR